MSFAHRALQQKRQKYPSCILILLSPCLYFNSLSDLKTYRPNLRFADLDSSSQSCLRRVKVSLQGRAPQAITDIVSQDNLRALGPPEISQLLQRNFSLGRKLEEVLHTETYISRHVSAGVILQDHVLRDLPHIFFLENAHLDVLKKQVDEKLICSTVEHINIKKTSRTSDPQIMLNVFALNLETILPHKRYFLNSARGEPESEYRKLCAFQDSRPIHWLQKVEVGYIWKATEGDTKDLLPFLSSYHQQLLRTLKQSRVSEDILLEAEVSRVVLCAEPGMGKSSTLAEAARKAFRCFPDRWILFWNLADFHHYFKFLGQSSGAVTRNWVEDVLCKVADVEGPGAGYLSNALWGEGNVMLFMDAFDEVPPEYQQLYQSVLRILAQSPIRVMWVATRECARKEAEEAFNVPSLNLLPLTPTEQQAFILRHSCNKCVSFAKFPPSSNPLYLKMFVSSFAGRCRTDTLEAVDQGDLYDSFLGKFYSRKINARIENHLRSGGALQLERDLCSIFVAYREGALKMLCGDQIEVIFSAARIKGIEAKMKEAALDNDTGNLLRITAEGNTVFMHTTFAEYLCAQWLSLHWNRNQKTMRIVVRVLSQMQQVRVFFDYILSRQIPLHRRVIARVLKPGDEHLSLRQLAEKDAVGRTVLHLAAQRGDEEMLRRLLQTWEVVMKEEGEENVRVFLDSPDQLWGLSPLYHAAKGQAWGCVRLLVQLGASVTSNILLCQEAADFVALYNLRVPKALELNWPLVRFENVEMSLVQVAAAVGATDSVHTLYSMALEADHLEHVKTVFHVACEHGRTDVVSYLLQLIKVSSPEPSVCKRRTSRLEDKDYFGRTPLLVSIEHDHSHIVQILLEAGADPKVLDKNGWSALHYNALTGNEEIADLLFQKLRAHGARKVNGRPISNGNLEAATKQEREFCSLVSTKDKNGWTPLHIAVQNGHMNIVRKLLDENADKNAKISGENFDEHIYIDRNCVPSRVDNLKAIDIVRRRGFTPLHLAVQYKHILIAALLLKRQVDVCSRDAMERTPLHIASELGDGKMTSLLLAHGADISAEDSLGKSPLHYAVKSMNYDVTEILLKKGANVSLKDTKGQTPLCEAIIADNVNLVRLLVEYKADVNEDISSLFSPLYMAIAFSHADTVKALLQMDAKLPEGKTPLLVASAHGRSDIVQMLLRKKTNLSDTNMDNCASESPRFPSCEGSNVEGLAEINTQCNDSEGFTVEKQDVYAESKVHFCKENKKNTPEITPILNRNADVNLRDERGFTALHHATHGCHMETIKLLLENKSDVNATTEDGITPLLIASLNGQTEIVKLLINHKADVNMKEKKGFNALHCTAQECHVQVAKLLLENKLDVNTTSNKNLSPLMIASLYGHTEIGKLLISHDADINLKDVNGFTALHIAAQECNVSLAKLLLENKADINAVTDQGLTPLMVATMYGNIVIAKLLINHNVDVTLKDRNGATALHYASKLSHIESVKLLLQNKSDVNATTYTGITPLLLASLNGHTEIVNLLVDHKADIFLKDVNWFTALHYAITDQCHMEIIKLLLKCKSDVNAATTQGFTPLMLASAFGYTEIAKLFINHKADVTLMDSHGLIALHIAAQEGRVEVARFLLENNSHVNSKSTEGFTPLMLASMYGQVEMVKTLISHNANILLPNKRGFTALHYAARQGHTETVKLLLEKKPDVNAITKDGLTPLMLASVCGHTDIVKLFINHNANITLKDKDQYTALHLAVQQRHVEVVKLLLENKADVDAITKDGLSPLMQASGYAHLEMAKLLMNHKANVFLKDKNGSSALHFAAEECYMEIAKLLLENESDVNAMTSEGFTPLILAAMYDHLEMAKVLINNNANIFLKDLNGFTALHYAVQEGHVEVARFLLENNSNVDATTNYGFTPLMVASSYGHLEIAELLINYNANCRLRDEGGFTALHFAAQECHVEVAKLLLNYSDVHATNDNGVTPMIVATLKGHIEIVNLLRNHNANGSL